MEASEKEASTLYCTIPFQHERNFCVKNAFVRCVVRFLVCRTHQQHQPMRHSYADFCVTVQMYAGHNFQVLLTRLQHRLARGRKNVAAVHAGLRNVGKARPFPLGRGKMCVHETRQASGGAERNGRACLFFFHSKEVRLLKRSDGRLLKSGRDFQRLFCSIIIVFLHHESMSRSSLLLMQ